LAVWSLHSMTAEVASRRRRIRGVRAALLLPDADHSCFHNLKQALGGVITTIRSANLPTAKPD